MEEIIKQLALRVSELGFISKSGALAQVSTATTNGANGVFVAARIAPFNKPGMQYLSPDKNESGIAFWQSSATKVIRQDVYLRWQENDITLTMWINGDRVKNSDPGALLFNAVQVIQNYRITLEVGSPIRMANIDLLGDSFGDVVSGFGWDDTKFKYHEAPHALFQVRFRLSLMVSTGCSTPTYQIINPAC